jgi:hypothetical protein
MILWHFSRVLLCGFALVLAVTGTTTASDLNEPRPQPVLLRAWTLGSAGSSGQAGNVILRGTLGQTSAIGQGTSTDYRLGSGFWAIFQFGEIMVATEEVLPAENRLYSPAPNPFNPMTELKYAVAEPGRATVLVYDLRGRVVRSLVDSELGAGVYTAQWDGRDDQGGSVASGTYICQFTLNRYSQVVKLTLLK